MISSRCHLSFIAYFMIFMTKICVGAVINVQLGIKFHWELVIKSYLTLLLSIQPPKPQNHRRNKQSPQKIKIRTI